MVVFYEEFLVGVFLSGVKVPGCVGNLGGISAWLGGVPGWLGPGWWWCLAVWEGPGWLYLGGWVPGRLGNVEPSGLFKALVS